MPALCTAPQWERLNTPAAQPLERQLRYLPHAYRLAVEWLDAQGDNRTAERLHATIEFYEQATGTHDLTERERDFYRDSATAICARRFWNFEMPDAMRADLERKR